MVGTGGSCGLAFMKSWTGLNHGISLDIPRLGKRRAEVPQLAKDLVRAS